MTSNMLKATRTAGSDAEDLLKRQEPYLVEYGRAYALID